MYISGEYSIITALLGCKDISGFLTRYEMIKAVSKSDTELLQEVNGKMEEICSKQNGLNQQKAQYQKVKKDLDEKNKTLKAKQAAIERDQEGIAASKVTLAQDRAESDALLAQLTAKNRMYTEYRNEDEKLQQQVESGIVKVGDHLTAKVDKEYRMAIARNHTATHLLQAALREVLGDHVHQAGSYQDASITHFDFTHFSAVTPEELARVQKIVNDMNGGMVCIII